MNIIYTRLLELGILHDYFQDGKAKDLHLAPTQETLSLFKSGRMLWREIPGGIVVLYRSEKDLITPEVQLSAPLDFYFYLYSSNSSQFFNITDLSKGSRKYQKGDLLAFKNNPSNASQNANSPEKISLDFWDGGRPKVFTQKVKLEPIPSKVILQVKNPAGQKISSGPDQNGNPKPLDLEIIPDDQGEISFEINLPGQNQGNYSFTLRNAANTQDLWKKEYFLAEDSLGSLALGVVKLSYLPAPAHLYGSREYYALDFKRKSTKWTFFIVSQNQKVDLSSANLSILDKGNPPGSPYSVYNFQRVGASPNADIKINNSDTVVFKSQVPIPFFESPKLNLELRRTPGNRVLFTHLPNPSRSHIPKVAPGEEISEIYVFI
ncbi:hypothetical protein [Algoriphagus mannitolivorans]|uniref:hypothetical protein n=1 Tax=Algoriphagus mannitolivorans TaxID=226504 RepID=UPI00041F3A90|nr:hypothetical protein [Algoriphagus mannitolivorans]